jgi:hypothetical protein
VEEIAVGWWLRLQVGFGIGSDFLIVRDAAGVTVRGAVSGKRASEIRAFVRDEFPADSRFAVVGRFGPARTFRLRFVGRIDPISRQRIRNVLVQVLR